MSFTRTRSPTHLSIQTDNLLKLDLKILHKFATIDGNVSIPNFLPDR